MNNSLPFSQRKDVLGSSGSQQGLSRALCPESKQAGKEPLRMKLNYCSGTKAAFSFFLLQQFTGTR